MCSGRNVNSSNRKVANLKGWTKYAFYSIKCSNSRTKRLLFFHCFTPLLSGFNSYDIHYEPNVTSTAYPYIVMEYAAKAARRNYPRGTILPLETIATVRAANRQRFTICSFILMLNRENILYQQSRQVILSDFGLATR